MICFFKKILNVTQVIFTYPQEPHVNMKEYDTSLYANVDDLSME